MVPQRRAFESAFWVKVSVVQVNAAPKFMAVHGVES